jgi:hypothetical protein
MSHGWAFEGDSQQNEPPCHVPVPALLPADKNAVVNEKEKNVTNTDVPLIHERSTASSTVRMPDIKDEQHRIQPPMSHGWANEGPAGGIVPLLSFKDEVGQARAREDTVQEPPPHKDETAADMLP